jgi:hypothetical protein
MPNQNPEQKGLANRPPGIGLASPGDMFLVAAALLMHLAWVPPAASDASPEITTEIPLTTSNSSTSYSQASTDGNASGSAKLTTVSLDPTTSQNSQSLATVRVPSVEPGKPSKIIAVEDVHPRRNWLILSIVQHSAATFDAYSTRQAVSSGATEADPLMRPFAQSPAIYAAIQVGPAILDYAARRMQRSSSNFLRRAWWVPQSASTGLFLFSGAHNLQVANRP